MSDELTGAIGRAIAGQAAKNKAAADDRRATAAQRQQNNADIEARAAEIRTEQAAQERARAAEIGDARNGLSHAMDRRFNVNRHND